MKPPGARAPSAGETASRAASRLSQTVRITKNAAERPVAAVRSKVTPMPESHQAPIVQQSPSKRGDRRECVRSRSAAAFFRSDERLAARDAVPPRAPRLHYPHFFRSAKAFALRD